MPVNRLDYADLLREIFLQTYIVYVENDMSIQTKSGWNRS